MGAGVYKWPLEIAANIAVKELLKSPFEETFVYVIDQATRTLIQKALEKHQFLDDDSKLKS